MKTIQYLDAVKAKAGIPSDYRLAKLLGVTTQNVSNWRAERNWPSPLVCFRIANALGIDPAVVVAHIEQERAERAGRGDVASGWGELIERLGGVAAAVMVSAGLYLGAGDAHASTPRADPALLSHAHNSLYIMSTALRRLMVYARRALPRFSWDAVPALA